MKIRALRPLVGEYGVLRRDQSAEIADHIAQKLIKAGLAVPSDPPMSSEKAPVSEGTTEVRPRGGRTGKAKSASLSLGAQAQETNATP